MNVETRDALRTSVIEKLLAAFPTARQVTGGVAFVSETLDEDTGKYVPVELKVALKHTADTERFNAYDIEEAVAQFNNRPGRRTADPVKAAEREEAMAARKERKEKYTGLIMDWMANNEMNSMTATDVWNAIPQLKNEVQVMYVGGLLKDLCEAGMVTFMLNDKRKKIYSKVQ